MQGYKNSDIEWIGSMPSDWKLDKIKYIANLYGRIGWCKCQYKNVQF